MPHSGSITALVLDPLDNVATLLSDVEAGGAVILKGAEGEITVREAVCFGHKIALREICPGDRIVKYGQGIGFATSAIHPGDWVHLHNMASALDADFQRRITG